MTAREIVDRFRALAQYRRYQALRIACDDALAVWTEYRSGGEPIVYVDSVVGMRHVVDDLLPARALAEVDRWLAGEPVDPARTQHDYVEPLVAIRDEDLELPTAIGQAYAAIEALHANVFSKLGRADEIDVLGFALSAVGLDPEPWANEWWTRAWDAWASAPDLGYPPSPLTPAAFAALAAWDLQAAVAALDAPDPATACLRAIVRALDGRQHAAIDGLSAALALDDDDAIGWLERHLFTLVPEAIAVHPDRELVALIGGGRVELRDRRGKTVQSTVLPGCVARFVRFSDDGRQLWIAGDRVDALGPHATFWHAAVLGDREPGPGGELRGARTLVALGPNGEVVAGGERLVALAPWKPLGDARVQGAAFADGGARLATHDGAAITLWQVDAGTRLGALAIEGGVARIAYAREQLLVVHADGHGSLIRPSARIRG